MFKKSLLVTALCFSMIARAQDTITVMTYNLLNYGNYTSYCTSSNNNASVKDPALKTIMTYAKPDILCVNEISPSATYHQRILTNVLNVDGVTKYARGTIKNLASSDIVNMIYYNTEKLGYHSHRVVQSSVRDIDLFRLYIITPDLLSGDTIYVSVMTAHLKAGSSTSDAISRGTMARNVMAYIKNNFQPGNFMIMGDFNLYTSDEEAWQQFTNYTYLQYAFVDPINKIGNWNNNVNFAEWHTQSTHTSSNCFSGGGMDDRFDFILTSKDIRDGKKAVKYIPGSYKTIGQDGMRFNKSLTDYPTNNSAPEEVINALYASSDHLPVMLKLMADKTLDISEISFAEYFNVVNPLKDIVQIDIKTLRPENLRFELFDLSGKSLLDKNQKTTSGSLQLNFDVKNIPSGFYILKVSNQEGRSFSHKLIKL
ncbi:MAG: T9SS type A sorting domain-containing protein [Bacteroidales bacterium]|jgi:endonuclease/exonuclease/phosphatase family metal-dependent hydrolase|nr:T9SS type A sorting domain-containing protein [Bacteroidales bacterium]